MAKIKYAAGLTALLNKHFGFVFQPNATNQTMKSDSNGARTRWTRQTQRQQGLMKAIRNWRIMSAVTKANWVTFAATYPQASRRNPAIFLSGYQLFLKRNHYCFLNHGIDCDFMEDPSLDEVFSPDLTFSLTASDNSLDVTELYISNFGILPKLGQFVLIKIYPMSETSGQFFAPIEQTIEVQEVFIDGLFVSFDLTGLNENLTFSVYLSKVCHPSIKYVGTKIRYMGCFTPKTFLALTDTPDSLAGEAGNPIIVNPAGDGLVVGEGGGGGITCEDLVDCPIIISILTQLGNIAESVIPIVGSSIPPIIYGNVYSGACLLDSSPIPSGDNWRFPSYADMLNLKIYANSNGGGGALKEVNLLYWLSPNSGATNTLLFNARGSGILNNNGALQQLKSYFAFWCLHPSDVNSLYTFYLRYDKSYTYSLSQSLAYQLSYGRSIRLCRENALMSTGDTGIYVGNNGQIYRTIFIDSLEWLADNLCETLYSDFSPIPHAEDAASWDNPTTPLYADFMY